MRHYLVIITIVFLFVSCNTERFERDCLGIYMDYSLFVKVQNELGENLLDERHPNYINIDTVHLYRIASDGCEVKLYDKNSGISKGFRRVSGSDSVVMLQIALDGNGLNLIHYHGDTTIEDDIDTYRPDVIKDCKLLLKWNNQNTNTDTIYSTFIHLNGTKANPLPSGNCSMHLYDSVYLNGKLIVTSREKNVEQMNNGDYPIIVK